MKVSKKSWHYRLIKNFTTEKDLVNGELANTSLCEYFQKLVILLIFCVTIIPVVYIIFSPIFLVALIADYLPEPKTPVKAEPKEPKTLVGKWFKAKKEKVCPLIEWTE